MPSLFISCVSNEFAHYRDAIRRDLSRPNLDTKIQEDFNAYGGATLEKLDEYIQHCEAVIHICGDMTGSMANEISIEYINKKYSDFGKRFPALRPVLDASAHVSYTQWEAWLAIYHGKRLFIVTPTDAAERDGRYIKDPEQAAQQREHVNRLREQGYYDEIHFTTEDELVKKLYQSKLGDILNQIPKIKPVNLPYQSIGNAFKGREDFIEELFRSFSNTSTDVIGIALYGLGGMGKTRLAVEYALQHKNNYTALLFVNAATPETLLTNIANLSVPGILHLPEYTAQDEQIKYIAVIKWLTQYRGWLLILDNADTPEAADKVEKVFAELQQGHVLITTRIDNWSRQVKKKPLDVLSREAAIAFLLETTDNNREKTTNDYELAGIISDELGYLALALEQARAYIVTKELSLATYHKKWKANRADVLVWFNKQLMQYPASVAITWQTSFAQLSVAAITLLNRLAWLAPDPIPKSLLEVEAPDAQPIEAMSAWEELKQYSLATSAADKKTFSIHKLVQDVTCSKLDKMPAKTFFIHRLVQKLTRSHMNKMPAPRILNEALNWVDNAFTGDPTDVNEWPVLEPLVPHILSLLEHSKEFQTGDAFSKLMNDLALLFYTKAQYSAAEPLMRRALQIDEQNFGSNHPNVAIRLNNLALLLKDTNRLQEAELLMRRALEIDEQSFGSNHPNVARDINNLALLLKYTNSLQEAEPLMRRALQIDEQSFGSNHPNIATYLNNLAQLLKDTNRLQEAEPLMRRALQIDEQSLGSNHPNVARDVNNLALLLHDTNRLQEAEPLMRRALEIDEQSFGPNHPNVARDANNLAQLLQDTNRLQEAELLIKRALEINEQSFGSNHPNIAIQLNNLAALLNDTNRLQEAEPLMRRALQIDEQSLGSNHPKIAIRLNNLAQLLKDTSRLQEAEPLMRRALIIFLFSLGSDHPNTKTVLSNYVILLQETGKSEEEIQTLLSTLS